MQQASRPPSHRRWVWRSRRVCDVGNGSLPGAIRLVQQLPRLMPAVEGVVPGRRRPVGQHRKCLVAWATTAPANPDPLVPFVVRIFEALSVTDDGPLAANRAQPGEQFQRDLGHPGSVLFSGSGSAIKRITAGVKAGPDRRCQVSIWWLAFTLQVKSVPNEKRISRSAYCPHDLVSTLAGLKRLYAHVVCCCRRVCGKWLPENHMAYVVSDVIDQPDLSAMDVVQSHPCRDEAASWMGHHNCGGAG